MLRHWKLGALAMVLIPVGWLALQQAPIRTPIVVSRETTYLTEPLAEDGLPDYSAALLAELREGVTPENNGAIEYLQAMWPAEIYEDYRQAICEELGMEVPIADGMASPQASPPLLEAVRLWLPDDGSQRYSYALGTDAPEEYLVSCLAQQPWSTEQASPVAMHVAAHEEHYRLLHAGLAKETFYLPSPSLLTAPYDSWIAMLLPTVQSRRDAARCLATRAHLRIGEGDYTGAWEDCRATYSLAGVGRPSTIVEALVAVAIESIANDAAENLLNAPDLDADTARACLRFYRGRPLSQTTRRTMDVGERRGFLTTVLALSGFRGSGTADEWTESLSMPPLSRDRVDWNRVLAMGNGCYDELVAAYEIDDWSERSAALEEWGDGLDWLYDRDPLEQAAAAIGSRRKRSEFVGRSLLSLLLPAINAVGASEDRQNLQRQLMPIAAALAVYRTGHGGYPESLDALTPDLLPEPPTDLFHGNPFAYRRTGRGYLLYSLGPNGQDDGGSHALNDVYHGYAVGDHNDVDAEAIAKLLDSPPDSAGEAGLAASLKHAIPDNADDHAVRMPPVVYPLPQPAAE